MSESEIKKKITLLKNYEEKSPVLSVYLSFDEKKSPSAALLRTGLNSLLTTCLDESDKKHFANVIEKIFSYLEDEYDSRSRRSVVVFAGEDMFEVLELEFALPAFCQVADSPYLEPLLNAVSDHDKYLVLLVDRKKARFFTVGLGEIREHRDLVVDMVPQRVKVSEERFYGREDKIFRHIEDHLNRHLKIVAGQVERFVQGRGVKFVILGGHEEMFKKVKDRLPKNLLEKIRGEFVSELNIPLNDIFEVSKKAVRDIENEDEYRRMHASILQAG